MLFPQGPPRAVTAATRTMFRSVGDRVLLPPRSTAATTPRKGIGKTTSTARKTWAGKSFTMSLQFLSLNVSGSYHTDDFGLPGPLTKDQLSVNRRASLDPLDKAETEDGYLKLGSDLFLGNWGDLVTDLSYRNRDSKSDFPDPLFPFVIDSQHRNIRIHSPICSQVGRDGSQEQSYHWSRLLLD